MHSTRTRSARRLVLWTGLLAVLIAAPAWAQENDDRSDHKRGHDPEEHLAKLQEELDLSDEQVEQIRAIMAEQHPKFVALHEQEGDRESKREAFRQLREETHSRVGAVLTEEQRARLEELHAEFKESHGHDPGHGGMMGNGPHGGHEQGPPESSDNS